MTEELLTRLRTAIIDYKAKHGCTYMELAEQFIRSNAFGSYSNKTFKLKPILSWKVLEEDDIGDIIIHDFESEEEAQEKFEELYPNGAKDKAKKHLMYQAPSGYVPHAGKQSLEGWTDAAAIDYLVHETTEAKNVAQTISDVMSILKDESETGLINNVNPVSVSDAIDKRKDLQSELEHERARTLFNLLREEENSGQLYILPPASWKNQNMAQKKGGKLKYPELTKMNIAPEKHTDPQYFRLLELDRFLSGKDGVSVGMVLSKAHKVLAGNFGANPEWRESINGSPAIKESTGVENFNFGKHMGSNLIEMIDEMANKGFDIQPIFDSQCGGNCVGIVKLSDIVGLISDLSFELNKSQTVSVLENYGVNGLIRPPPPQIDASTDLSVAGNILKHGNECVIVKFDPNNWLGNKDEEEHVKGVLEPGYHIMTAHDIIAYRLPQS